MMSCLQALAHAPVGVVKDRGPDWVPLCLSYLSAKQPALQPRISADAPDQSGEPGLTATVPQGRGASESDAARVTEDAGEDPASANIGARCDSETL